MHDTKTGTLMKLVSLHVAAALLLVASVPAASPAQDRGFGLGVIFGQPTGLSGKFWLSPAGNAVDFAAAWSFGDGGFFSAHATYLWHFPHAISASERFVPYVGPGVRFGAKKKDAALGVRVAGGIAWWPKGAPVDVFLEIAPVLNLIPATDFDMTGGVGARYYFN